MGYNNKYGPGGATNATRSLTEAPEETGDRLVIDPTERPEPARQIALIRSLVAYAQGHEDRALGEIRDVLDGATLADLMTRRAA